MNYIKLSREVSYALRHAPWEYELEIDENGWVEIEQLLIALRENNHWNKTTEEDLYNMIEVSEKKRHEILQGKIRALYGHSLPHKIAKDESEPPILLYHGTVKSFINSISREGLLPKGRQYVHLSVDVNTAFQVAKRRDNEPVILEINAKGAWSDGVKFYQGNDKVWLADMIPIRYIKFIIN